MRNVKVKFKSDTNGTPHDATIVNFWVDLPSGRRLSFYHQVPKWWVSEAETNKDAEAHAAAIESMLNEFCDARQRG